MIIPYESAQVVSSVFGQAEHLDLAGFEHLLQELGMPVGRFMQEQKASRGRSVQPEQIPFCVPPIRTYFSRLLSHRSQPLACGYTLRWKKIDFEASQELFAEDLR
jgi:hypothetical protein